MIVAVAGQPPIGPPETQIIQQVGDWWVSDGTVWLYLPIGGDTIAARNVALIPHAFGEDNVQDAMEAAEAAVQGINATLINVNDDIFNLNANKVAKAGDTMFGLLTLAGDPIDDFDAATKRYVDEAVAVPVPVRVPIGPTRRLALSLARSGGATIRTAISISSMTTARRSNGCQRPSRASAAPAAAPARLRSTTAISCT